MSSRDPEGPRGLLKVLASPWMGAIEGARGSHDLTLASRGSLWLLRGEGSLGGRRAEVTAVTS